MICEQSQILAKIVIIEKQIAQLLQMQINQKLFKTDLSCVKTVLAQIFHFLKTNSQKDNKCCQDESQSIEEVLQQQQQRNRNLIKKQLELRQYQNSLIQQLTAERIKSRELKQKISKLNDELRDKSLQILSLKNQNKSLVKDSKISYSGSLTTRQTIREVKAIKQQTLYALYNNHKNKIQSTAHKHNQNQNQNYTAYKLDKFEEKGNKTAHSHKRRNSEQLMKKSCELKRKSTNKK